MSSLESELNHLVSQMDTAEAKRHIRAARYRSAYARALRHVCGDNTQMADLILEHTNGFYIRKDDSVRIGPDKDKPHIICEVYLDDPIVRTEVNMRREMLRYELMRDDINVDEFRILASKRDMKNRHPFKKEKSAEEGETTQKDGRSTQKRSNRPRERDRAYNLEIVKRAICLVFGEDAYRVLDKVNAAELFLVQGKSTERKREDTYIYRLRLYSDDQSCVEIIKGYKKEIMSYANELGLCLINITVLDATEDMLGCAAFPRCADPIHYTGNNNASDGA